MNSSTDDETSITKDRERKRSTGPHARQSLGAVGRVASRVRISGKSRLSKANSFMQRQKPEAEDETNASPWGVGVSVDPKLEKHSSGESRQSTEEEKANEVLKEVGRADVLEISSPLSADQHSPRHRLRESPQNTLLGGRSPVHAHSQDRVSNDRKSDKRPDRGAGMLAGAAGGARGLVKSVSKFGFRHNDNRNKQNRLGNDLRKVTSVRPHGVVSKPHHDDEASHGEPVASSSKMACADSSSQVEGPPEAWSARIFNRTRKSKLDLSVAQGKGSDKCKGEGLKGRGKSKLLLAKSTSQALLNSPKSDHSNKDSLIAGDDDEGDLKVRKGRGSWFGLSGDQGAEGQLKGLLSNRIKPKAKRQPNSRDANSSTEAITTRPVAKTPKDVAEVQDFAVDEFFDSDEDEMETGSAPRSVVDDDFITYQTGKGKKGPGNRSKNRLRLPT